MREDEKIQGQIERILIHEGLTNEMRTKIKDYYVSLHSAKITTKLDYLVRLKKFGEFIKEENIERFEDVTRKNIDLFLSRLKTVGTRNAYICGLKTFYKWLGYEETMKSFKPKNQHNNNITPSQLLTPEDVVNLSNHMATEKNKVLTLTLFESAARISEVLDLRIGDIEFRSVRDKDNNPAQIAILHFGRSKGNIQKQPVTMIMFSPELHRWINSHPYKDDDEAHVFFSTRKPEQHVDKSVVWHALKNAAKNAGIKKKVNPHWLRHSMLSFLANQHRYNEQLLMWRAGWKNTAMAKRYIHSGGEIERKAYKESMGLLIEDEKKKKNLKPKVCAHCNQLNPYTNNNCDFCGMPLDLEEYKKALEKKRFMETGLVKIKHDLEWLKMQVKTQRNVIRALIKDSKQKEKIIKKMNPEYETSDELWSKHVEALLAESNFS